MKKGDLAPDFTLLSTDGEQVNLYATLEEAQVVLFFYLKAFTPLCISQACSFQTHVREFESASAKVYGISSDSEAVARRFGRSFGLSFPLLLDTEGHVRETFHVPKLMGFLPGRSTFVIGRDRRIIGITHAHTSSHLHVKESLQFVRE